MCRDTKASTASQAPGRPGSSCSPSRWARSRTGASPGPRLPAAPASTRSRSSSTSLRAVMSVMAPETWTGLPHASRPTTFPRLWIQRVAPSARRIRYSHTWESFSARGDGGHVGLDGREVRGLHQGQERLDGDLLRVGRQAVDLAVARGDGDGTRRRLEVPEAVGASLRGRGPSGPRSRGAPPRPSSAARCPSGWRRRTGPSRPAGGRSSPRAGPTAPSRPCG